MRPTRTNAPVVREHRGGPVAVAKPLSVGSQVAFVASFLGRRLEYTYEVREHVQSERLVISTAQVPFPMETTYAWEDAPAGATR